jgi:uncharacterized membrane protein YecN with MAPEG domain
MLLVTSVYASLLGLVFIFLTIRTIGLRRSNKVALGTGGVAALERVIGAHSNFSEYVPLSLFLILCAELQGLHGLIVNGLGLLLLTGRAIYSYGISQGEEKFSFRVTGKTMTIDSNVFGAMVNLGNTIVHFI